MDFVHISFILFLTRLRFLFNVDGAFDETHGCERFEIEAPAPASRQNRSWRPNMLATYPRRVYCALFLVPVTALLLGSRSQAQSLTASPNPSNIGSAVTLAAPSCGGAHAPEVQMSFYYGTSESKITTLIKTVAESIGTTSITWNPTASGTYYLQAVVQPTPAYCTGYTSNIVTQVVSAPPSYSGYINPKYVVVDVIYAPPGSKSTVGYSNSTTISDTQSVVNTSSTSTKVSVSLTKTGQLYTWLSGSQTDSYSDTLTQQNQDTQSVTLSDTNTSVLTVYGPGSNDECDSTASDYVGVDHDCDTIRVWLNPVMTFKIVNGTVTWTGYGSSGLDPVAPIHIDNVKVGCLNGALPQTSSVCASFYDDAKRTWAANENWPSGQGPGLTTTDFAKILAADKWGKCTPASPIGSSACPTYTVPSFSLLPPEFYLSDQENVPYQQAGTQWLYTISSTGSNMKGESSTTTNQQTYGVEDAFTGSAWLAGFKASVGLSQTLTTSNEVNDQTTVSNTVIGTTTIVPPACSGDPCNPVYPPASATYGEATNFDIFIDQNYGTFVFVPSDYE